MALLDRSDQWHQRCADAWDAIGGDLVTTEAVVTEASHLVNRGRGTAALPLQFLLAAGIPVVGLETAGHRQAVQLMERYARTPMDYADASLVVLSDVLATRRVFTTDRRGFRSYRGARHLAFEILP